MVGKGQGQNKQEFATQLATLLGSELVQHDSRFSLESQRPQTIVELTVLNNDFDSKSENRPGTRLEPAGKDAKGKMQYRQVNVTLHYEVVNHRFGLSYTVQDLGTRKQFLQSSLDLSYHQEFQDGHNAPTEADRLSAVAQQAVAQMVYKLSPTEEILQVMVPKGSMESFINLAEAGLWSRYSEAIEARSPLPNPMEESYRQYALGLSYEALGYGTDRNETTLRYLEQAAQRYNSALSLNPPRGLFFQGI